MPDIGPYARLHRRHRQARRRRVTIKGWLHNRRSSGKIHFLIAPRRQRLHSGGDVEGRGRRRAVQGGRSSVAGDLDHRHRARPAPTSARRAATRSTSRARRRRRRRTTSRSRRRSTASTTCSTAVTSGSAPSVSRRSCASATKSSTPSATSSTRAASSSPTRRSSRPRHAKGTTTLFPAQYFEDQTAYLTQSGQLYNEANAMALGRVYCFGPTFRAEKSKTRRHLTEFWMVEPEMAYADSERRDGPRGGPRRVGGRPRARQTPRRELTVLERDTVQARSGSEAVSADDLRRGGRSGCRRRACRFSGAATSAARTRRRCRKQFDRPVMVHRYPAAVKAFYMKPDPERPELALGVDVLAPGGLRRDHRRRRAARGPRSPAAAHRGARPAAGGLRVVSRPAPRTARCPTAGSAWASSASSPGSASSSTSGRRFRIRVCCTGCTRRGQTESRCRST